MLESQLFQHCFTLWPDPALAFRLSYWLVASLAPGEWEGGKGVGHCGLTLLRPSGSPVGWRPPWLQVSGRGGEGWGRALWPDCAPAFRLSYWLEASLAPGVWGHFSVMLVDW